MTQTTFNIKLKTENQLRKLDKILAETDFTDITPDFHLYGISVEFSINVDVEDATDALCKTAIPMSWLKTLELV